MPDSPDTALFVLPIGTPRQNAPVAAWATAAGWAQGAAEILGSAWVISDNGTFTPEIAARNVTRGDQPIVVGQRSWRTWVPEPPITLAKDLRRFFRGRRPHLDAAVEPWHGKRVSFVWQRHELFRRDGVELAQVLHAPLVLSVHAMQVAEAEGWGVSRPGWARLVESRGELPQLQAADLIACVSEAVAEDVARRGVPESRILVTPNGVDSEHFAPRPDRDAIRRQLNLDGCFVIGWSGSFRSFHGLELALEAMAVLKDELPQARLLLMGDGQQRTVLEEATRSAGLDNVIFVGPIPYERMPSYLGACDAGLVLSPRNGRFHYSPVKLREYMACGLPVIAHAVGELRTGLTHETDALLISPDSADALVEAIRRLVGGTRLRRELSARGMRRARTEWSWVRQVQRVMDALGR